MSGVVTLAILARHLGKSQLGVIALFRTVVTMVDLFANFNTWQAVIKYGTEAIAQERREDVLQVIKLAAVIDLCTAWVGALVVVGLAFLIPGTFDWSPTESWLCAVYAVTLISKVAGTTDGIYRVTDSYRVQAIVTAVMAGFATVAVAIAVWSGAGFATCVLVLILGEAASNLVVTVTAFWVASRHGYGGWHSVSLEGVRTKFPGIGRFMLSTNAQLTVRTMQGEVDMMIVGTILGKAAAGLFRVVKQLGTIPGRLYGPFEQVLYTELAREVANRDFRNLRRLLKRASLITAGVVFVMWLVIAVLARPVIHLIAGSGFEEAAPTLRLYLFAMALGLAGLPVLRTMIVIGRPGTLFLFDLSSLIVLIGGAIPLTLTWGLDGMALALIANRAVQILWPTLFLRRHIHALELEQNTKT